MLRKLKAFLLRRFYRFSNARAWKGHRIERASTSMQAATTAGAIKLRMFHGDRGAESPLIVYFHGGGWVIGDLDSYQSFCQALCQRSGCSVIAVDYRLAPEHSYPAAHDDCLAATHWIATNMQELGPANGTLVLAGDSAGANLATATCLAVEPGVRQAIAGQILIYPVVDHYESAWTSYQKKIRGYKLTGDMMVWFWDTYLAGKGRAHLTDRELERATPLKSAGLGSLPPALIVTAEHDPLRDEGIAYTGKLRDAGVEVDYRHFDDADHGFVCSEGPTENYEAFMSDLADWIGKIR